LFLCSFVAKEMLWWRQRLDEGAGKELAMRPAQRHTFAILESEAREPTVKVTLERLPESRVQLQIEIDEDRLERSLDSAYKRIAQKNRFPGFRPGKAPRAIVERAVGRSGLIREALDKLVPTRRSRPRMSMPSASPNWKLTSSSQ
jgi:hypothetical protein